MSWNVQTATGKNVKTSDLGSSMLKVRSGQQPACLSLTPIHHTVGHIFFRVLEGYFSNVLFASAIIARDPSSKQGRSPNNW